MELQLAKQEIIDHVIIQEDISFGQRVRQYVIEGRTDNNWTILARGLSIGQKRIECFTPVKVDAIRLKVVESTFTPVIRRLAVFNAGLGESSTRMQETKIEKNIGELRVASDGQFEFDLSSFIPFAEQYHLWFRAGNDEIQPTQVSIWLQNVETPGFATINADGSIRINITAYPNMKQGSIVIKGRFDKRPSKACQIYLQ